MIQPGWIPSITFEYNWDFFLPRQRGAVCIQTRNVEGFVTNRFISYEANDIGGVSDRCYLCDIIAMVQSLGIGRTKSC